MAEYIEREAAIKALNNMERGDDGFELGREEGVEAIQFVPAADVEPVRHGKWVPVTNGRGGNECDQCHRYAPSYQDRSEHLSKYCPRCGAKMDL